MVSNDQAVFILSDVTDKRNPLPKLDELKESIPSLRLTAFLIPGQCSEGLIEEYNSRDWIQVGAQGYHGASFECAGWGDPEASMKVAELDKKWPAATVFRAPNWATNELVEAQLEVLGWTSVCSGVTLESWGNSKPPRFVYNCSDVTSISGTAHNSAWEKVLDGKMDYRFATECAAVCEIDFAQELCNSWSHDSPYGKKSIARMREAIELLKPTGKIADFGGNDGEAAAYASSKGVQCVVVDGSISRVAYAREVNKVHAIRSQLEVMSFDDNEFEWGFCSHTLEHAIDLDAAWSEIKRVCEKGCFVVVPIEPKEVFEVDPSHHNHKTASEWIEWLDGELLEENDEEIVVLCKWSKA